MDLLRSEIINITKNRPEIGLEYYNDLLDIIDTHHDKKPDTSIETCKAIIEGISKLIIHKIKQEPIHILDKSKEFKELTKRALNVLNDNNGFFDIEFVRGVTNLANKLGTSRNEHSDIGHGRASTKKQVTCSDFSLMISGFTESISVYLLRKLHEVIQMENHYDSEQMQKYNTWLDESIIDFPIQTQQYSKMLYEYDNDLYYLKYEEEFLVLEVEDSDNDNVALDSKKEVFKLEKPEKEILYQELESDYFNSDKQKLLIIEFAKKEKLDAVKLGEILDPFFFYNEVPSMAKLSDIFLVKPNDNEIMAKTLQLTSKINNLIDRLTENK